jgi:hypothetical protein
VTQQANRAFLKRIPSDLNHLSASWPANAGHPRFGCGEKGVDGRDKRGHDVERTVRGRWFNTTSIRISSAFEFEATRLLKNE